ncbi:MAG: phosphodiester glycosidase family protein [Clostridia bacterium]|nr:phosphodiester glycosidase family protein [Clostridia bacterium]
MQRRRETVGAHVYEEKERVRRNVKKKSGPLKIVVRVLSFLLTFVIIIAATVFVSLKMICGDTSPAAKELLVTTLLETGQMKDIASWFLSAEEIQQIVDGNKMSAFENDIDSSLISIDKTPEANENGAEQKDIEVVEISGRTFFGTLLIIKDPSRVELASTYPWKEEGVPLDKLVNDAGAVAGINGGLYNSTNNSGGKPYGVVVCKGEIQFNEPQQYPGLVLIGFTEDNILEIIPIGDYSKKDIENLVRDKKIRDAVTFQEEASDKNNHFVQLVINGEARDMNGMGSGLNPRTAIGQRSDGSVLMLVTDGRGKAGHLGASASDLINIMVEYGAVNAANLDGGSSSCMYYNGEYLMTSVTFYYSNSSWKLPLGFVVK